MFKAEEARVLCEKWNAQRVEEAKQKADEILEQISKAIEKDATEGKHILQWDWSYTYWGSAESRNFGEKELCKAGYKLQIGGSTCLISW